MYDVIIIGAGVSGAATARELSRYKVKACVIEKEEDVCCGTSKANSAIVHAGYDAAEGSLMAKLNVRGNQMMEQLSKDLDFSSAESLFDGMSHAEIKMVCSDIFKESLLNDRKIDLPLVQTIVNMRQQLNRQTS